MLNRARIVILPLLAAFWLAGSLAGAQAFGRVTLVVTYPDGRPAEGVKIIATCDELTNFLQEKESDNKGKAILTFMDATKSYNIRFEMEGYEGAEFTVKPRVRGNITREVTLDEPGRKQGETPPAVGKLKPAEEAFNAGLLALRDNDQALAKTKFEEAITLDPKLAVAHSALAGIYLEQGDHQSAIAAAEKVIEILPEDARAYGVLYDAHSALGNKKEARAALSTLENLGLSSDSAALVFNQGASSYKVGDNATAETKFKEALAIDPELVPAMSALAAIYMQEQRYAEAVAMAEQVLAREPTNQKELARRWEAYKALGDEAKAKEAFETLAAANPEVLAKDLFDQGVQLFEGGDVASARGNFERVLELQPDHPRAHYRLGLCHLSADEKEDAREHLQRFVDLAPDDPEASSAQAMLDYL